jgi:NADPH:quinone reductase-like Zn-dependent oxidoreductase
MRQVWITKVGPPGTLVVREAPDPSPGPGHVRIRVEASGINFADVMARQGLYPDAPKIPCVVGYEVNPLSLRSANKGVLGVNLGHMWHQQELLIGWLGQILSWHGEGKVRPHVDRAFSFADAPAAHAYLEDRKNVGKLVLVP